MRSPAYKSQQLKLLVAVLLFLLVFYFYSLSGTSKTNWHNQSECFSDKKTKQIYCKPSFQIIGASRAGATILFNYLQRHPQIYSSKIISDTSFAGKCTVTKCSINDYWKGFRVPEGVAQHKNMITGELAPSYLTDNKNGDVPKILKQHLPKLKFLVVLQDPVERLISDYNQDEHATKKLKKTHPSLDQIIAKLEGELKNCYTLATSPENRKSCHTSTNLLTSGLYADHINEWLKHFPKKQFLFLNNQDLQSSPNLVMQKVYQFLEVPEIDVRKIEIDIPFPDETVKDPAKLAKMKVTLEEPPKLTNQLKEYLCEFYKSNIAQTAKLTGIQYVGSYCDR